MNKKISTPWAVLIILLVAGFFTVCLIANIENGLDFSQKFLWPEPTNGKQNVQTSQSNKIDKEKNEEDLRGLKIIAPSKGETVKSPLVVTGEAKGNWFFEGDFPIKLIDSEGHLLMSGPAVAKGEWMTEDWVSFEAVLKFTSVKTAEGFLLLEKNNPSGLPENNSSFSLPIKFLKQD